MSSFFYKSYKHFVLSKLFLLLSKASKKSTGKSCLFLYSLLFIFVFTTLLYLSSNFKSRSWSRLSYNLFLSNLSDVDFVKFSFDCLYKLSALFISDFFDCSLVDKYLSFDYLWLISLFDEYLSLAWFLVLNLFSLFSLLDSAYD